MDFKEYEQLAMRTKPVIEDFNLSLTMGALGASGEAGEISDYVKKVVFHNHEFDMKHVKKEMGDVLWYLAYLADIMDTSLEEIAIMNIGKLKERYPNGFNSSDSINRRD